MKWYYYLHSNGDLIGKNPIVVDSDSQYFDSPFVKYTWLIETDDRGDAWKLVIEALARGARIDCIRKLTTKWNLTAEDLKEYIIRNTQPTEEQQDGMDKFIKVIFDKEPNTFWDSLLAIAKAEEGEK